MSERPHPTSMQAWHVTTLGEPESALGMTIVPTPVPGPGQVVVRMLGAATNFSDVLMCRGEYQVRPPLPFTPGAELCGEVVQVGERVDGFAVGDRVIGAPVAGAFAELVLMDAATTFPAPDALDDAEAAALFVGHQTAWFALHRRARIAPGEVLLVHAAAGGVGSAAVQLGKAAGAKVIGVTSGGEKTRVVQRLGADIVIDRHEESFASVVNDVTDGRGADVIFDPVGGEAYRLSTKCIAFEGRLLVIGFAGGEIQTARLNHALVKNYSVLGLHWGLYLQRDPALVRQCHDELTRLAAERVAVPLVSERLARRDLPDGLSRLAAGATTGRIVVTA